MKFGPPSRPFLQVPVISLAQKIVVSEPGHEPKFQGRPEQGSDLYKAMLEDTGQAVALQPALIHNNNVSNNFAIGIRNADGDNADNDARSHDKITLYSLAQLY